MDSRKKENYKNKNIAVVGVSANPVKYGHKIFRDLIKAEFRVTGVNPGNGEVLNRKIYKTLKEIEPLPDLVITVVPPEITEKIVEECIELGIKEIWMQPGSESKRAIETAEQNGISVTHNA
ncbi:MAG: CoA-binding protein, partial [Candidatus Sumerlaeia bacterium]|nr:CoA-binding protein [Candidatus Sumerlaeia bacterium]